MPGGPATSVEAAIIQAAVTTKPGLRNSDGCTEPKPSEYHRTAPLPKSVPKIGRNPSATNETPQPITARRRTCTGVIIVVSTIAASATAPKTACR